MRINLKHCVWIGVMTVGLGFTGVAVRAATPAAQVKVEVDFTKNKNYKVGMSDGRTDFAHHRDHYKKRSFKNDDDRNAYEAGYQANHHK